MKIKNFTSLTLIVFCTLPVFTVATTYIIHPKKSVIVTSNAITVLQKNLQYDFSKSSIRKTYYSRLNQLAAVIIQKRCPVALRGYADSVGTYKGNWVLSQKRTDAVKQYLVNKGVPQELIISTAFGSTEPIATNKTAAGRQQNRRVEIKIKDNN